MKILQKIKQLYRPINHTNGWWHVSLISQCFDGFQSIFVLQIGAYIIKAIEHNDINGVKFWGIIMICTILVGYFFIWFGEMSWEVANGYCNIKLKKVFFKRFLKLDNTKVEAFGTGKMQSLISEGISRWSTLVCETSVGMIVEILSIIYAFSLILTQAPNIYYFFGFIFLFFLSTFFIVKGLKILQRTKTLTKDIHLEIARKDVKIIMSKFEILQNNKIDKELDEMETLRKKIIKIRQKNNTIKSIWQLSANGILDGLQIWIYVGIGMGIIYGSYSFAYMLLMLQLVRSITKYAWQFRNHLKNYFIYLVDIEKLQETFDSIPLMKNQDKLQEFKYKNGDIHINNLNFSYGKNKIFQNFNLTIKGGNKIAFVGESGGGKSTLIKLISGYISPDSGQINIDGNDIHQMNLISYYKNIGYLSQEPNVFDGTIYENLTYALDDIPTQQHIDDIIKKSKCEFIFDFKNGIQTEIGERGVRLSGGQKQRLAIAKIMLKDPKIILLDEPTSALDSFNEEKITQALDNLFVGKTVIIVAHRLQTVKKADEIILIEGGEIIERGNHTELSNKNGIYKKMLDLQSGF